jgi:hypothetical protein
MTSTEPNTSRKQNAKNKFVCQIKSITSVTKVVLTIITPTSAMPAMQQMK